MRYLFALLVAACTACGASPRDGSEPTEAEAQALPQLDPGVTAPVHAVWVNIDDTALLSEAEGAIAWFHDVTGIPTPPIQVGDCTGDLFRTVCIRLGDPGDHPELDVKPLGGSHILYYSTIDHDIASRGVSVEHVFRHEYAHHWIWPNAGVDGAGHSDPSQSLMHSVTNGQCSGFSSAELAVICDHHDCNNPVAECDPVLNSGRGAQD